MLIARVNEACENRWILELRTLRSEPDVFNSLPGLYWLYPDSELQAKRTMALVWVSFVALNLIRHNKWTPTMH